MCLSSVYVKSGEKEEEIMSDVARIEAGEGGFWLVDLFGKKMFISGSMVTANLMDGFFVFSGDGVRR